MADTSTATSLSRRIVTGTGIGLFIILGALAWVASLLIEGRETRRAEAGILQAAEQAALVVDRVVSERAGQVRLLASLPPVVDAARAGAERSAALGLAGLAPDALESRFDSSRTLGVDARTRQFLRDRSDALDLAEVLVTDVNGFNAITTERTSDFVQSDEAWWRTAMARGSSPAEATFDESARQVSISVASAVREQDSAAPVGVMKVVYGLNALQEAVNTAAAEGVIAVSLIDREGRLIASSARSGDLRPVPGHEDLPRISVASAIRYDNGAPMLASVWTTNGTAWRVVAESPRSLLAADLRRGRTLLALAAFAVFATLIAGLASMNAFLNRRLASPAAALAAATEAVAAGDLTVRVPRTAANDEMGRLARATASMIRGLRDLVVSIRDSAKRTADMALDLTASSEEMAASAQAMAQTSTELSRQSVEMAQLIQDVTADASKMVDLSAGLTAGAAEGVKRNQRLRNLAQENRQRLESSARELESLTGDVLNSAAAAEALAAASKEIRDFVELVQRMARQSKMLAFSAALEASRAGHQETGFGVVAREVERLSTSSAEAAERTERLVKGILAKVEESRASAAKSAAAVERVLRVTEHGFQSFGQVEGAVQDTEAWTVEIQQAALASRGVVEHTRRRLEGLATGTAAFAAAMQEVAASAEEQSASTEEVAATASALAATADELSKQAGVFRMEASAPVEESEPSGIVPSLREQPA
ncbi:MAG TPA: methyl-accepting chemotaxis protein [Gemmatimonadales bacterium]|nr:methyl-accepting chemotaxis protein [Gemmatimonadales bacterium]